MQLSPAARNEFTFRTAIRQADIANRILKLFIVANNIKIRAGCFDNLRPMQKTPECKVVIFVHLKIKRRVVGFAGGGSVCHGISSI
jgi:hypothetical protein